MAMPSLRISYTIPTIWGGGGGGGLVVCNISTLNAPSIFLFILEFSKDFKICFQFVKFYNSPHVEMQ